MRSDLESNSASNRGIYINDRRQEIVDNDHTCN
jgi:hypothetical protein